MSRLSRNLLFSIAAVLAGVSAVVFWMSHRPPRIARLLPEADAIFYADLQPLRLATHFDRSAPAKSAEFQAFVDATGIVPERDLDEVAFAVTRRPDPDGPNGPVAYTEIFKGRFDAVRLSAYLAHQAVSQERYAGQQIYSIPSGEPGSREPRLLRVTVLRQVAIAASNAPTAEQIHAILDHDRSGAFSGTSPSLLSDRFPEVPALSTAWGIGSLGLPFVDSGHVALLGLDLPLPAEQPMIASLRYLGVLRLRLSVLATTPDLAMRQTGALTGLLGVVRGLTASPGTADPAMVSALGSIAIAQAGSRTVITADLPTELLREILHSP